MYQLSRITWPASPLISSTPAAIEVILNRDGYTTQVTNSQEPPGLTRFRWSPWSPDVILRLKRRLFSQQK